MILGFERKGKILMKCCMLLCLCLLLPVSDGLAGDLVYEDTETGLMWQIRDNGVDIGWAAAKDFCGHLETDGFNDWRMPTQDELASLYRLEAANTSEYYILQKIQISACCQWASDVKDPKVASFDFEYGNRDWGHPMSTVEARVLAVRDMQ